jgi:GDP-mannose 6-dehydrogenase
MQKTDFHTVVLRCSVPPGTTREIMGRLLEEASGRALGEDFGIAFVPEFLREGVAVEDFRTPPKTVIGASDPRTAEIVAQIFAPVDATPISCEIETAELVKYVDNVWHATKVCFANEVGRLARAQGIDGREVMDVFVQDTKLNLSPYYLKPGFAYGGSCLPKEVRATAHLAKANKVNAPLIDSLASSNECQIAHTLELIRATGARRVAVLGIAFKPGTDDVRESPALDVMAALMDEGIEITGHDPAIGPETDIAAQLAYVKHGAPGLARLAETLPTLLRPTISQALEGAEAVLVTQNRGEYRAALTTSGLEVIDAAQLFAQERSGQRYAGLGW